MLLSRLYLTLCLNPSMCWPLVILEEKVKIVMYCINLFHQVRVKPGESALAFYTAENRSSTPIVGVSTYNVTPMKVMMKDNNLFVI